jgi:PilZ domain
MVQRRDGELFPHALLHVVGRLFRIRDSNMSLKSFIAQAALGNRRIAARLPGRGFAARHWAGKAVAVDSIRDISATGVYLVTEERWNPGTPVTLTLHRAGVTAEKADEQVTLQARVARTGEDGVGLAFEIPSGLDPQMWLSLVDTAPRESGHDTVVGPFKAAKAMAFFHRICVPDGLAVWKLLRNALGGRRFWNAIEIGLQAESFITAVSQSDELYASPRLVMQLLHDGSWADDQDMQHSWAGLLATSCSAQRDESNAPYIEVFSQLTTAHARLLNSACMRATKYVAESGMVSARHLVCTAEETMNISGTHDLLRMGRTLLHLSELGLLEERLRTSMFIPVEGLNLTPTSLGLALFARCNGFPGEPKAFYGLGSRSEHWRGLVGKLG